MKKSDLPLRSDAEVAALYRALRRAGAEQGFSIDYALAHAFDRPLAYGAGYVDNFRKGRIDRAKAAALYDWLRTNYPLHAEDLDAELVRLNAPKIPALWESFIKAHGVFGQLSVGPPSLYTQSQHQVKQQQMDDWEREQRFQQTLPLNVPFTFYLRDLFAGYAIGLQWMRGHWFGLPLSDTGPGTALSGRRASVPDHGRGVPLEDMAFNESEETGLHRFAFILTDALTGPEVARDLSAEHAIPPEVLDAMATRLAASRETAPWKLLRLHVMFVVTHRYEPFIDPPEYR